MKVIQSTAHYQLYWYDSEQSILVIEMFENWTWQDAHEGIALMNEALMRQVEYNRVYGVGMLSPQARVFPKDGNAISHILQLMKNDPSPEELAIFVVKFNLLIHLIQTAMQLYQGMTHSEKYVFAETLDDALKIIADHKMKQTSC